MKWRKVWQPALLLTLGVLGCRNKKQTPPSPTRATDTASAAATGTGGSSGPPSHEGQRPPKPKASAAVVPPNLPSLKAQKVHIQASRNRERREEYPCGSVWTGDEEVPLECEGVLDERRFGSPAVALIPYNLLRSPRGDMPAVVDHRTDGFEGRTLRQGKAGACTAFALTSQINHALGLWTGAPGDLSVMQVWARYHHAHTESAIQANLGRTVANDSVWPYDQARARAWMSCKGGGCLNEEEKHKLAEAEKKGVVVLEQIERLPSDETMFDVMQAKLAAGRDIGVAGRLPRSFRPVGEPGSKYIPDFRAAEKGGHAFTVVGYAYVGEERYFLLKNSWGEKWGDGGYGWIHEQSLRKIVNQGYVVIVDPVSDVGLRRHRRKPIPVAACPAGEVPDSIDNDCKPVCKDGGPRHAGYCGVTEDCTKGFVNLAGECVIAAPKAKGTEPKTGITFHCAPTGCVYNIPNGVGGCKDATCQKSCPAPDYRLGSGKRGLLCLE